jgi:hypothetical protein
MSMAAVTGLPGGATCLNTAVTERERLASVAARCFARIAEYSSLMTLSS